MTKNHKEFDPELIAQGIARLKAGEVIIAPTDTHYTLMADPLSAEGTSDIYKIKERDPDFPLTVFLSSPDQLDKVAFADEQVHQLVKENWPGFLTLILPKKAEAVPDFVTAGLPTVAVACHHNEIFSELLQGIGGYAACTSANLSGQGGDLVTLSDAREQLGNRISFLIEGEEADAGKGNSIVDLTGTVPVLVRDGEIPFEKIKEILPNVVNQAESYKADLKQRQQSVATWRPTLEGKVALVTGAARGRGSEITRVLAQCGVHVMCTDLVSEGEAIATKLQEEGLDVEFRVLDVTKASSWSDAVRQVTERWGRLDLLINNAGYFSSTPLLALDEKSWQSAFQVNATGAMNGIKAAASVMKEGSNIVNMSSVFGLTSRGYAGIDYESSKGALVALTKSAARELATKGIRVNALAPGLIRTPMTKDIFESHDVIAEIPLGREVSMFDIVNAVCFLVSSVSSYITGVTLPVDGGLSL